MTSQLAAGREQPETLERPLAEANHRIANSLSLIASVIRLHAANLREHSRDMTGAEVQSLVHEIGARIDSVGLLHKLLAGRPDLAAINIGAYLREVCTPLVTSLSAVSPVDLVQHATSGLVVAPEQAPLIALIVTELVVNAIKYSHPTHIRGEISIDCREDFDGTLVIDVADDGVGLPEDFDPERDGDFGLWIVRALASQLHGTLTFNSTDFGLRVRILVPRSVPKPSVGQWLPGPNRRHMGQSEPQHAEASLRGGTNHSPYSAVVPKEWGNCRMPQRSEQSTAAEEVRTGVVECIPHLRAFARSLTSNRALADDLVHEAIARALAAAHQYRAGTNFKAWIFTILRNLYYNEGRKRADLFSSIDDVGHAAPSTRAAQEVNLEFRDFRRAFAQLRVEQCEALMLVGVRGLNYEDAAKICGCAVGTIKSRTSRAREELKRLLSIPVSPPGPKLTPVGARTADQVLEEDSTQRGCKRS